MSTPKTTRKTKPVALTPNDAAVQSASPEEGSRLSCWSPTSWFDVTPTGDHAQDNVTAHALVLEVVVLVLQPRTVAQLERLYFVLGETLRAAFAHDSYLALRFRTRLVDVLMAGLHELRVEPWARKNLDEAKAAAGRQEVIA